MDHRSGCSCSVSGGSRLQQLASGLLSPSHIPTSSVRSVASFVLVGLGDCQQQQQQQQQQRSS